MDFPVHYLLISDKIPMSLIQTNVIEETGVILPLKNSLRFYNGLKSKYTLNYFQINRINIKGYLIHCHGWALHRYWSQRLFRRADHYILFEYLRSGECEKIKLSKNKDFTTSNIFQWKVHTLTWIT